MPLDLQCLEKIEIFVTASALPKMQSFSDTDPFAVVYFKDHKTKQLVKIGSTDVIMDTVNPNWTTSFPIDYLFEVSQEVTIRVYHQDGKVHPIADESKHIFLGEVHFLVSDLMRTNNQNLVLDIAGGKHTGKVNIRGEILTNCRDLFVVTFSGNKLANKDGMFGTSDPFLEISRLNEDSSFTPVWKSVKIENSLNPRWGETKIAMTSLCNNDLDRPLRLTLFDWDSNGKHAPMGVVNTSVRAMLTANGAGLDVIEADKKAKNRSYINSGHLVAANVSIEHHPTFSQFIAGGCEISLVVAIDFTGSNGDPLSPQSLHFIDPSGKYNAYQDAISSVASVLEQYDSDKKYSVYGFGGGACVCQTVNTHQCNTAFLCMEAHNKQQQPLPRIPFDLEEKLRQQDIELSFLRDELHDLKKMFERENSKSVVTEMVTKRDVEITMLKAAVAKLEEKTKHLEELNDSQAPQTVKVEQTSSDSCPRGRATRSNGSDADSDYDDSDVDSNGDGKSDDSSSSSSSATGDAHIGTDKGGNDNNTDLIIEKEVDDKKEVDGDKDDDGDDDDNVTENEDKVPLLLSAHSRLNENLLVVTVDGVESIRQQLQESVQSEMVQCFFILGVMLGCLTMIVGVSFDFFCFSETETCMESPYWYFAAMLSKDILNNIATCLTFFPIFEQRRREQQARRELVDGSALLPGVTRVGQRRLVAKRIGVSDPTPQPNSYLHNQPFANLRTNLARRRNVLQIVPSVSDIHVERQRQSSTLLEPPPDFYNRLEEGTMLCADGRTSSAESSDMRLDAEQLAWLQTRAVPITDSDLKYSWDVAPAAQVQAVFLGRGGHGFVESAGVEHDLVGVVLNQTSFFHESGGQIFDTGVIESQDGTFRLNVLNSQSYAGYVMHVGTLDATSSSIRVGASVSVKVDYDRRGYVASNHTMTHVLNYALKTVLMGPHKEGEDSTDALNLCDQKGSLVDADRLEFDFSWTAALTDAQTAQVEQLVNDKIRACLPVFAQIVPLASATQITSLRKVFGERYPDPVRVISVGADVEALIAQPNNPAWHGLSIEFCGGTHLTNTRQAEDFVITEESGIAKGIRRISGLTRLGARQARARNADLTNRISQMDLLGGGEELVAQFKLVKIEVDQAVISLVDKEALRVRLATIYETIKAFYKVSLARKVSEASILAEEAAKAAVICNQAVVVINIEFGADGKVAKKFLDRMRAIHAEGSFFVLSLDEENEKVGLFSIVSAVHITKGLSAKEWVEHCFAGVGAGKGGGSADQANGSIPGGADTLKQVLLLAQQFADSKLM